MSILYLFEIFQISHHKTKHLLLFFFPLKSDLGSPLTTTINAPPKRARRTKSAAKIITFLETTKKNEEKITFLCKNLRNFPSESRGQALDPDLGQRSCPHDLLYVFVWIFGQILTLWKVVFQKRERGIWMEWGCSFWAGNVLFLCYLTNIYYSSRTSGLLAARRKATCSLLVSYLRHVRRLL